MKNGSVLMTLTLILMSLVWTPVLAVQGDPIVIRGPVGSEQTDVRRGQEDYGPIARTDTLWSIAQRVRPHSSVTIPQVMSAIVQANPHAFLDNNPNNMESGYMLRIPSLQEIQMVNPEAARRHIELGEQLQQSSRRLQQSQSQAQQTDAQRVALLSETRQEALQAIERVRENYAEEFGELRQRMSRSIENTESVIAANDELRQRIDQISEALDDIQRNMVAEAEFQRQVRELMEEQQNLRLEQQADREIQQSQGFANRIMSSPLALILLAFLPALVLIAIATLVLRRRDVGTVPAVVDAQSKPAANVENATAAGMVSQSEDSQDDFELDEAMAEFEDLDDEEGDDLSALEDEMLVPDEDEEDSIQLDDDMDNMDLSEFDALDGDVDDDFADSADDGGESEDDADEAAQEDEDDQSDTQSDDDEDSELSQNALDELFSAGSDELEDMDTLDTSASEDAEPNLDEDLDDAEEDGAAEPEEEADTEADTDDEQEPSPADLFASEEDDDLDDLIQDSGEREEEGLASDDGFIEGDDEDFDFDKMMEQFAEGDDDDGELEDDDIESLLAKSDQLMSDAGEPGSAAVDSETEASLSSSDDEEERTDEDEETPFDSEAEAIEAEEALDFTDDSDETTDEVSEEPVDEDVATQEPEGGTSETEPGEDDESFIDIDDIIDDASDEPLDEEQEELTEPEASSHADQEDNLSAQLDLARAYLEMEEFDEARDAIKAVMEQADGELLAEAKDLLSRLPG